MVFVSAKVKEISAAAFSKIREEYVEPYSNAYSALLVICFLVFYALFALTMYFAYDGVLRWLGGVASHTFFYSVAYIVSLTISFLIMPGVVNSVVTGNPQLAEMLSQLPAEQRPLADILISDTIIMVSDWFRGVLTHIMLFYAVIAALGGFVWFGITAMAKGESSQ